MKRTIATNDIILKDSEVRSILGVSRTTLWRMRKAGDINARRFGGGIGYLRSEIEAYIISLPIIGDENSNDCGGGA